MFLIPFLVVSPTADVCPQAVDLFHQTFDLFSLLTVERRLGHFLAVKFGNQNK